MLVDHLAKLEGRLRSWSQAEVNIPGELLRLEFCEPMFGAELIVASGRIVDCHSTPQAPHPAADILVCRPYGPRLEVDGLGDCLLAESVVAAITVLPQLDHEAMATAVSRLRAVKALRRSVLPRAVSLPCEPALDGPDDPLRVIACYIVAFDGPQDMGEAHIWLKHAYRSQGIVEPDMPDTGLARQRLASPAVDGVFVIGRGYLNFDNVPLGFFDDESRLATFGACWSVATAQTGSLLSLFVQINQAATALAGMRLDPAPYLRGLAAPTVRLGN